MVQESMACPHYLGRVITDIRRGAALRVSYKHDEQPVVIQLVHHPV